MPKNYGTMVKPKLTCTIQFYTEITYAFSYVALQKLS